MLVIAGNNKKTMELAWTLTDKEWQHWQTSSTVDNAQRNTVTKK